MKNYQMKLNFGEDEYCHELYERWLEATDEEDNPRNWEEFKMIYSQLMNKNDT